MKPIVAELLESLEATQDEFWNISRKTANFLNLIVKSIGAKNMLEIGTSNGYSAIWIAMALRETGGKLTTIEFWDKRQVLAKENLLKCGLDDIVEFKLGSASQILKELEAQGATYDCVFIDANKSEYVKYFELVDKMLAKGGVIMADNITSHPEKVQSFVELISSRKDYQVEIIDLPDGLLIARKS